ncbi:MAG: putative bifunctional diguanylate cyclase/phosphodiesterase [Allorhizobium sp.]
MTADTHQTIPRRPGRGANNKITLVLLALSGMAVLGLVFLAAIWAATESDAVAKERQRRLVNDRLQDQMDRAAHEIQLMAVGFSSFLNRTPVGSTLTQPERASRSAATFGQIATTVFGYDAAFVVTPSGDLLLPADAETVKRYRWVKPLLQPLLVRAGSTYNDVPLRRDATRKSGQIGLMKLEGRPSVAGAVPIEITQDPSTSPGPAMAEFYLIAFRFLDGSALDKLSKEQGLAGARYARTADQDAHEIAFQIDATETRDPIGFIIWAPDLPGSQVVGRLVPVLAASGLIIVALFLALVARLRSSLRKLSDSEETAHHLALHDVLTDLPNRACFAEQLELSRRSTWLRTGGLSLALLDLDHFKEVNDTYGHAVGDELLVAAVKRMRGVTQSQHFIARLGGDEFALLISGRSEEADPIRLCNLIVEEIAKPFELQNNSLTVRVGCSAGLVTIDRPELSSSELLRRADVALYVAKTKGRNRAVIYDLSFDEGVAEKERLKNDLRTIFQSGPISPRSDGSAMPLDQFEVHYQSIHRADSEGTLAGAEALVRWRHPENGLLSPDRFIPLIEELGLMHRLGRWVLKRAVETASDWPSTMSLSVNVSPTQLKEVNFAEDVLSLLQDHQFAPDRLELELTEAALFRADDQAKKALSMLRSCGVSIALDDFGTGFSSLSHLLQFSIDRIKIDRSFVSLLGSKAEGAAIVSAVLSLSRSLGTTTTAEGVETFGQKDFLIASGCTNLQGYLFSKPMSKDRFAGLVLDQQALKDVPAPQPNLPGTSA